MAVPISLVGCIKGATLQIPLFESAVSFPQIFTRPDIAGTGIVQVNFFPKSFWPVTLCGTLFTNHFAPSENQYVQIGNIEPGKIGLLQYDTAAFPRNGGYPPFSTVYDYYGGILVVTASFVLTPQQYRLPFVLGDVVDYGTIVGSVGNTIGEAFAGWIDQPPFPLPMIARLVLTSQGALPTSVNYIFQTIDGTYTQSTPQIIAFDFGSFAAYSARWNGYQTATTDFNHNYIWTNPGNARNYLAIFDWRDNHGATEIRPTFSVPADDALFQSHTNIRTVTINSDGFLVNFKNQARFNQDNAIFLVSRDGQSYREIELVPQTTKTATAIASLNVLQSIQIDPQGIFWFNDNTTDPNFPSRALNDMYTSFGFNLPTFPTVYDFNKIRSGIILPCLTPCFPSYGIE